MNPEGSNQRQLDELPEIAVGQLSACRFQRTHIRGVADEDPNRISPFEESLTDPSSELACRIVNVWTPGGRSSIDACTTFRLRRPR